MLLRVDCETRRLIPFLRGLHSCNVTCVYSQQPLSATDVCPLASALRTCSTTFSTNRACKREDWKRVFLFTNQDRPNLGDTDTGEEGRVVQVNQRNWQVLRERVLK